MATPSTGTVASTNLDGVPFQAQVVGSTSLGPANLVQVPAINADGSANITTPRAPLGTGFNGAQQHIRLSDFLTTLGNSLATGFVTNLMCRTGTYDTGFYISTNTSNSTNNTAGMFCEMTMPGYYSNDGSNFTLTIVNALTLAASASVTAWNVTPGIYTMSNGTVLTNLGGTSTVQLNQTTLFTTTNIVCANSSAGTVYATAGTKLYVGLNFILGESAGHAATGQIVDIYLQ